MSGYFNKTSPNSYGGTFGLDANTGGGVGNLHKHQASIPKGGWNMGDALSSPQGEWDDNLVYDEELDDIDDDVERKAHTAYNKFATDSLRHYSRDKNSLGNVSATVAGIIGFSEGKENKRLLENYIKGIISEISGNIEVQRSPKAKNTGGYRNNTVYPLDTNDLGSMGMTNAAYIGTKNKTYRQNRHGTTDGAGTTNKKGTIKQYVTDMEEFNLGNKSSSEIYFEDFDDEYMDDINLKRFK
jgi:hypothetical protein